MALLTRLVVIASVLLGVAAGLWPLSSRPAVLVSLALVFTGTAGLARWRPAAATGIVFACAYVSYGLVRLIAGPEVAAMPYFLAGFVGLAIGGGPWTGWQARAGWRVPLAWWATSVAVTWPFFAARDLNYSLAPSLAAGPTVATALLQMSLALWMDRLLAASSHPGVLGDKDAPLRSWRVLLIMSALATASAAIYQRWWDLAWLSGEPWIRLGRAVGLMGDANPMGVATALWAPVVWGALSVSRLTAVGALAAAFVLWLAAWSSGARTTLILMTAGVAALGLMLINAWGWSRRAVLGTAAALGAAALAGVLLAAPRVEPTTPIGRLLAALPQSSPGDALYELLWRRDGYGLAAVEAIKEHPAIGVGVGRFALVAGAYHQRLTGQLLPPDNAQNLWRQTFAEQGVIGLLPLLWLTGLTIRSVVHGRPQGMDLLLRVMLVGLGASLLVGYPVQDAAIAVTLATLVADVARQEPRA